MKRILIFTLFLCLLVLTACDLGRQSATPEPATTSSEAEAEETTAETTQEEAAVPEAEEAADAEEATEAEADMSAAPAEEAAAAATFGDAWESVDCATLEVAPEIAPMADCGYVTVPENRASGGDSSIKLAVVRVRTEAANAGSSVFLAVGGPGGDGLNRTTNIAFILPFAPILADHDFIFFSQRGTKHAQPRLACQAFNDAPVETATNGWSSEERHAHEIAAMQSCIDEAVAQGIDLSAYNSVENAADVDSIRQALGYDKIVLYGQSYGTQLAQFVMRNHPGILESVILDGILAATATKEADYFNKRDSWQRVFAACAADETCRAEYPDPEGSLAEVYAALEANPQQIETVLDDELVTFTVDGSLAMEALFSNLPPARQYGVVPAAIYQMREGDWTLLSRSLPHITSSSDKLMHFAMICSDDPNPSMSDIETDNWAEMYSDGEYEEDGDYVDLCSLFNLTQLPDSSDELVVSDIPALLLQGGLDPVTPVANGNNVETGLSNSYNIVFPDGGHVAGTSECGAAIMTAFINDPSTEPDTSCIPQTFAFAVPLLATAISEDGTASISMQLPAGWRQEGTGYLNLPNQILLWALPPQTPEEAIMPLLENLPDNDIVDGNPVAGHPTKRYQADGIVSGTNTLAVDIIAFADEAGTYVIFSQNQSPASLNRWRTVEFPALLETVFVGGK